MIAKELADYLAQIRKIYDCFMDIEMSMNSALRILYGRADPGEVMVDENLMSYICKWKASSSMLKLAPHTSRHVCLTSFNVYKLNLYLKERKVAYEVKRSVLSSLAVELAFCITRGMQAYVTAFRVNIVHSAVDQNGINVYCVQNLQYVDFLSHLISDSHPSTTMHVLFITTLYLN